MGNYLVNFSLYTLAMVGVIFCALFVFKLVMGGKVFTKKSAFVKILDTVKLSPRKTLYVIKAGSESFLVAADADRTTLISKLAENNARNNNSKDEDDNTSYTNKILEEKIPSTEDIFNKSRKYDFLSKPIQRKPKLKPEKSEGLNSLYGDDSLEDEFASVLNLNTSRVQKEPVMKEIARKLNF